ncbi:hypothetical protein Bb109J_c0872 [Bdellovibrio bacteriovorus]|uniref:hypothetical protein n=1 Tax=Bdellovibrio bacteriovorus TaxID=959 RepID=UPI00045BE4C0|nr:hypothetical protein [Bdellovibrio bacteriovorus]AHZ86215.1 hypothetical protein EP01_14925 [Bdellovibrio bacteriovorus]BEV67452.1 hypothetical protein Bb109J_c0872 [Bdellovibrio bacteriovorus]
MKVISVLIFLFSSISFAQTVSRIQGTEATINLEGHEGLNVGDRVHFLNSQLSTAGEGEVLRLSAGGKKALVKIVSGKVKAGMTLEKISSSVSAPKETAAQSSAGAAMRADGISYASLSESDRAILERGEISQTRYVVGGILATYPLGLGIGHAVQGRYMEKGWIFTVGELASLMVLMAGFGDCVDDAWSSNNNCNNSGGLVFAGAFGFVGFRIWEAIDAWATPPEQNRRYRELKSRLPASEDTITFEPGFMPLADGGGALGLRLTF